MKQLNAQQKQNFGALARQFPEFLAYLGEWRQDELEKLPYAVAANLDVTRGRVQILTELRQALEDRKAL